MRNPRALLASIGTSVLLVAAVVASLLSVSVVFAVGGFDGAQAAGSDQVLVLDVKERARPAHRSDHAPAALVVRAPAATAKRGRRSPSPRSARSKAIRTGSPASSSVTDGPHVSHAPGGASGSSVTGGGEAARPAPAPSPPVRKPNLGDGVKKLGDNLSSGVRKTGSDLGKLTVPLGAPVSAALQQVANVVAALLQQATNALGALLGAAPRH